MKSIKNSNKSPRFYSILMMALAAIPFLALAITSTKIYPADILMVTLWVFITGGAIAVYLLSKNKFELKEIPLLAIPIIGLSLMALIGLVFAHNTHELITNNAVWLGSICLAILLCQKRFTPNDIASWLNLFVISASLTAFVGIVQHLFEYSEIKQVAKPASVFVNRNMATQFVIAVLPISLVRFFIYQPKEFKSLMANSIAFSLMLTYIAYTQTRAAWVTVVVIVIAFVVCIAIFSNFKDLKRFANGKYLFVSLISSVSLMHFNSDGFYWFLDSVFAESESVASAFNLANTGEARYKLFANSIYMGADNWVTGVGAGQWKVFYGYYMNAWIPDDHISYTTRASYVHNGYIQIFAEFGILGLLFLLFGLAACVFYSWRLLKESFSFQNLGMVLGAFGILFQANFSFSLHLAMPVLMLTFYLSLISRQVRTKKEINISMSNYMALGILVPMVLFTGLYVLNSYSAKLSYFDSRVQLKSKNYVNAFNKATETIDKDPFHRNAHVILYNAAIRINREDEAYQSIQAVLEKYPFSQVLLFTAAEITKKQKNWQESLQYYKRLALLFPHDALTIKRVGDAYRRSGDMENMKVYYLKAVELDPEFAKHATIKKFLAK